MVLVPFIWKIMLLKTSSESGNFKKVFRILNIAVESIDVLYRTTLWLFFLIQNARLSFLPTSVGRLL